MTRILLVIAAVAALGLAAVVFWPRGEAERPAAPAPLNTASQEQAADGPASFTVLVEGHEVEAETGGTATPMAQLPPSAWNASMISGIRAVGSSQVLTFVDGSETLLDDYTIRQLPAEVAFRAGYNRD